MAVEVRVGGGTVRVRPAGWWRWPGVAFAVLWTTLLAINGVGAVVAGAWLPAAVIGIVGLGGLHWILATFAASVDADPAGLRVRAGLLRRYVAAEDVGAIRVAGPTVESHVVLVVVRTTGRPRRLNTIRQLCTSKNRRALERAAIELSRSTHRQPERGAP